MELSGLTIILTDRCNFKCAYCYQKKGRLSLDPAVLSRVLHFFQRFFARECFIDFYGGEPLLAFDMIRRAVDQTDGFAEKRGFKAHYSISTNGSLLSDDVLDFLEDHEFSVLLSFDGFAQDISRKRGSFGFLVSAIEKILKRPWISLETNSVFTSDTVRYLSRSIELIDQLGVRKMSVGFGHRPPWTSSSDLRQKKEIARVRKYFRSHYQKIADIPWADLVEPSEKAISACAAGLNKMALAADGTLWGCFLFPQYFSGSKKIREAQKYCFGHVDTFITDYHKVYPRTIENYAALRMDNFFTPDGSCAMCDEVEECWVCPLAAALTSRKIGRIPALVCGGAKMWRREKRRLLEQFKKLN